MSKRIAFTSPNIAKKISKDFGDEVESFSVSIPNRHTNAVIKLVRKIEDAHQRAKKSSLVFRS